ncbi:MAG: CHAT domain-containing protein [Desulfovibrionaceae bacterium]
MVRFIAIVRGAGLLVCLLCLASCSVFSHYSLEQAEEVASSFEHVRKLPPKSSSDILQRIEAAQGKRGSKEEQILKVVTAEPSPDTRKNRGTLAKFYYQRSNAALLAGRLEQARADIEHALSLISPSDKKPHRACMSLYCSLQFRLGDYAAAVANMEETVRQHVFWNNSIYLAHFAASVGDAAKARKYALPVISSFDKCKKDCPPAHVKYWGKYTIARAEGDWPQAAQYAEKAVDLIRHNEKTKNWTAGLGVEFLYADMIHSLVMAGNRGRAENEARKYFSRLLDKFGPYNWIVLEALESLASVRLARGQAGDAEKLFRKEIELLEAIGTPEDTLVMARARYCLGKSLAQQGKTRGAAKAFVQVKNSLVSNALLYGKMFAADADVLAVMVETGTADEALFFLEEALAHQENVGGKDGLRALLLQALKASALLRRGQPGEAERLMVETMPRLLAKWEDMDRSHHIQLGVVSSALATLARTSGDARLATYAFQLACALKKGSVQGVINANAARNLLNDPRAAELARKEQDTKFRIGSLHAQLSDNLLVGQDKWDKVAIAQLKENIRDLQAARASILAELERIAPEYTAFTRHPLPAPTDIAQSLRPGEAMVVYLATDAGVCAWLIRPSGEVVFHSAALTRDDIGQMAARIRASLEPDSAASGGIAAFDLDDAYALYRELLGPFEGRLAGVEHLIVVKDGGLEQIPFAVLPTAPVRLGASDLPFGEYRQVPWLVRRYALSTVPTPESLAAIRKQPRRTGKPRHFVGFGDPIFSAQELAAVADAPQEGATRSATARLAFRERVDTRSLNSADLSQLPRLPETAEELEAIAGYFGPGSGNRIFLREQATESAVKAFDFRDFSVVSFATHGLKAGTLDGQDQPALALTVPTEASGGEDGLLTAEEILGLSLRADLVILSACDTAAPEGGSSEVLSGLARSFFYAGAEALLVSNWPVDSISTVRLTSEMMRGYNTASRSKAEALRQSMLALIDGPGYVDGAGKPYFSYAHPIFFAPFVLVGDGQ